MPPDTGIALLLASEARGSKKPALDEIKRFDPQQVTVPPGRLMVYLSGSLTEEVEVERKFFVFPPPWTLSL